MLIRLQELNTASCQIMANTPIYVNLSIYLYTIIRAVCPSTCNVMHNTFGHLISAPHHFRTLGWIGFMYGLMIGMGPKFFLSSIPTPPHPYPWPEDQGHRLWKFIVVKISFPNESF